MHSTGIRKAGVFSIGNNELNGKHGIQTFSKQTLYYTGLYFNKDNSFAQRLAKYPIMQKMNRTYYTGLLAATFTYGAYRFLFKAKSK